MKRIEKEKQEALDAYGSVFPLRDAGQCAAKFAKKRLRGPQRFQHHEQRSEATAHAGTGARAEKKRLARDAAVDVALMNAINLRSVKAWCGFVSGLRLPRRKGVAFFCSGHTHVSF